MKALLLVTALFLSGCHFTTCHEEYDINPDNGQCWKQCAQAAAASRYFEWNFSQCIQKACGYRHERVCK